MYNSKKDFVRFIRHKFVSNATPYIYNRNNCVIFVTCAKLVTYIYIYKQYPSPQPIPSYALLVSNVLSDRVYLSPVGLN